MSVRLDNFVDVKITKRAAGLTNRTFDTAVYLVDSEKSAGFYMTAAGGKNGTGTKADPKSASEWPDDNYVKTFFANGGKYLHIVKNLTYEGDAGWVANDGPLPQNEIVIFKDKDVQAADWNTTVDGPDQKIFLNTINSTSISKEGSGIAYRYVEATAQEAYDYGIAAIAAYYTKIDITRAATVKDYAFTAQYGIPDAQVVTDNSVVTAILETGKINATVYLAGANRNIGGSDSTGTEDITNLFMRIALQQTLTTRLVNLLVTKLPLNQRGINAVQAAVAAELNLYVNNGYIDTTKIWTDDDLYIDDELIVAQGSPLTNGYMIHISPITAQNYTDHQVPQIYLVYGDAIGIRKIVVTGEAF